jgi:hypothetical protein
MKTLEERFWEKVIVGDDGCWEWTGSRNKYGYGVIGINWKTKLTHRVAYELKNGPIPEGLFVCHHCDNPCCVRPDHLFLGSQKDNMIDMVKKGREGTSKLKESQVIEIRRLYKTGLFTQQELGNKFGVSHRQIGYIINKKSWSHI